MHNKDIRDAISAAKIKYWQVAAAYGCTDGAFSRKLRWELPAAEKKKILPVRLDLARE